MPLRRPTLSALALAAVSIGLFVASTAVHAEARALDEHEMRGVYGRADVSMPALPSSGSLAGLPGAGNGDGSDPGSRLTNALLKGARASYLDEAQFLAAWRAVAGPDGHPPTYDGRPVMQLELTADPVTISFDVDQVFSALAGGAPYHGPSGGTITLNNVDARGTTIWIWGH